MARLPDHAVSGLLVLALPLAGCSEGDFDRWEAVSYLATNRARIEQVGREFDALVPEGMDVRLEFRRFGDVNFSVGSGGVYVERISVMQVWDAPLSDPEVRRGLGALGWTEQDVTRVQQLVRSVDGIGIEGPLEGGGVVVQYRRHSMGMYSFVVSDSALVEESDVGFDGCSNYYLDPRTAITYGGPAFGNGCIRAPDVW